MSEFDDAYWRKQSQRLNVADDVRHVDFARFTADQCGGGVRFVPHIGWFRWNGCVWEETGDTGAALNCVSDAARVLMKRAAEESRDTGWAMAAASKMLVSYHREPIVKEMAVLPQLRTTVDAMDANRHLLTFKNGTVDLRTGELKPHDSADMMTQCAMVDFVPDAAAPRWLRFVEEIFPGNEELQEYYQTFLGMCITGEIKDHVLGVWYGEHGRNGKGTTVRAMKAAFGKDIIRDVPFSMFEPQRGKEPHTELIAGLRKARMVVAQEGNQGATMNTALIKNLSGGDDISTRHLHGKTFEFSPKFTLVLATNYLPEFSSGGAALWSRTHAMLFGECFADRVDIDLEPTIQGPEREGVAAWVVRGAVKYYQQGRLHAPLAVLEATEKHKDEVDPLKPLVGELFDYDENAWVLRSAFNAELREWRGNNGEDAAKFKPSAVKRHLMSHGVQEVRRSGVGWCYTGIFLLSDPPRPAAAGPGVFDRTADN